MLAAAFLPLRWVTALVVLLPAVILAALYADPDVSLGDAGGALFAAIVPPVFGYVVGAVLRDKLLWTG